MRVSPAAAGLLGAAGMCGAAGSGRAELECCVVEEDWQSGQSYTAQWHSLGLVPQQRNRSGTDCQKGWWGNIWPDTVSLTEAFHADFQVFHRAGGSELGHTPRGQAAPPAFPVGGHQQEWQKPGKKNPEAQRPKAAARNFPHWQGSVQCHWECEEDRERWEEDGDQSGKAAVVEGLTEFLWSSP